MIVIEDCFDVYSYLKITNINELFYDGGLNFSRTNIKDISFLLSLPNLRFLCLNYTSVSDISVLEKMTNLISLEIINTQISKDDIDKLRNTLNNTNIRT